MSAARLVLREIQTNGGLTSRDVALALGMSVKIASTCLTRLHRDGRLREGDLRRGGNGRPARIWWPA